MNAAPRTEWSEAFLFPEFNHRWTQMDADTEIDLHVSKTEFPLKAETHAIIGCAFDVLNELGHGLCEKCYENALAIEFKLRGIAFDQQRRFAVLYKGQYVGEFIPDLIAYGQIVVDTKAIETVTDRERGQMLNFLRITRLPVGLILNFKHARLGWERIVLSTADKRR
jgi:GxxExxY protein